MHLLPPEPCTFLSRKFSVFSIIRRTNTVSAAGPTADRLFIGQSPSFFEVLKEPAEEADAALTARTSAGVGNPPYRLVCAERTRWVKSW
jgi:hypothetical protein